MASSTDTHEQREHLWSLIKGLRFGMFTTRHPANGHLHARPMTTLNKRLDEDDRLWFFMSRRGDSVDDLRAEPDVNISYADAGKDCYVSVSGRASLSSNQAKVRELWSTRAEAWFPGGVDDPDVALVEVVITHAHYWDVQENKLTQLFQVAKAVVTRQPPPAKGHGAEVHLHGGGA